MTDVVAAEIKYQGKMTGRPAYYATDYSRDRLALKACPVKIRDLRAEQGRTFLAEQGFLLVDHVSRVSNFHDGDEVNCVYLPEIGQLAQELTGAVRVLMTPHGGAQVQRKSGQYRSTPNTRTARFIHVDFTRAAGVARSAAVHRRPGGAIGPADFRVQCLAGIDTTAAGRPPLAV